MNDPLVLGGIAGVITALTGLVVAVMKVLGELKRNTAVGVNTAVVTSDTNRMVNNHADAQSVRLDQLEEAIRGMGGIVPVDPGVAAAKRRVEVHDKGIEG